LAKPGRQGFPELHCGHDGMALKKSAQGGAVQNVNLNKLGDPISITTEKTERW
jgi:hypothetical protein